MTPQSPLHDWWAARGARFAAGDAGEVLVQFRDVQREYGAARESAALFDLSQRTQIELTGADRVRFLHNLCTNDIKALAAGQGREAFLTTAQGKLVGHTYIFATPASLLLDTVPGQAQRLLSHLDKYLITDDVKLIDRADDWAELFVTGPKASDVLAAASATLGDRLPPRALEHAEAVVAGTACWVRRVDLCGDSGYQVVVPCDRAADAAGALLEAGAVPAGMHAFDILRIESGTALFGRDMTEENLPQEVGRNDPCISFTKGCYLGQETVARIDAHGHVNQHLVGLRLDCESSPEPGTPVLHEGKEVGHITSAAVSPRFGVIALAYVRRGHETPGHQLELHDADPTTIARVAALPFDRSCKA